MKPKIFIGSSVEGLNVAYSVQQNLTHDAEATVWDQGVFELSSTTIESLNKILNSIDFAILVFSPDDETLMRGQTSTTVRDNVLFELGLFIGKIGRERVFFLTPDSNSIRLPTDLIGVTPGRYDPKRKDGSLQSATGAACNQIRTQMKKLGLLIPQTEDVGMPGDQEKVETNGWIMDFLEKDYLSAKDKLSMAITEDGTGIDKIENTIWLAYVELKINEVIGLESLRKLAKDYENNVDGLSLIISIFNWENYNLEATKIAESALKKYPENNKLIAALSSCYAKEDEQKAINLLMGSSTENDPELALKLAEILVSKDLKKESISILHVSHQNFPNNEKVMKKLAELTYEAGLMKEALYLYRTLCINNPEDSTYLGSFSNACLALDLYNEAMIAAKKASAITEDKEAWLLMNIGNLLNNKGFYSEAIKYLNNAISMDSDSEYAHDRLSKAIKNKNDENKKLLELIKEGRSLIKNFVPALEMQTSNSDQ